MFNLTRVTGKIWHLNFEISYDLNLHFFRYQEFYESPNSKKTPNMPFIDLMDIYSKNIGGGNFTYTSDWTGFNLPGEIIFEIHKKGISDKNRYDELMIGIARYIKSKEGSEDFYIIGTASDDPDKDLTFNHELAHGIYFLSEKYRKEMYDLLMALSKRTRTFIFKELKKLGYDDDVLYDEAQAYLATGLYKTISTPTLKIHSRKFKKVFDKYASKLD